MAGSRHTTKRRLIAADDELWEAYGDVVGDGGRSADLRDYMIWRVNNPDVALPGNRLGPRRRDRQSRDEPAPD